MKNKLQELQTHKDLDCETLNCLGGNVVINNITIPPPTTAVLSLLEMVESPFVVGFSKVEDIKLRHINEALYILKYREQAVNELFDIIRFEKIAEKNADFFKEYLNSLNYNKFSNNVYKFAESLGIFNTLETILLIQDYINTCYNAFNMLPEKKEQSQAKKKEILTQNG
jgi:hypothetical protein